MTRSEGEMQAVRWHGPLDLRLDNVRIPEVTPKSVLVKVQACAICGSDSRIFHDGNSRISPPRTIGHEIAGVVVDVGGEVKGFSPGDRITVGADIPCGKCAHCSAGRANCCQTNFAIGYQYDCGFAEYIRLEPLVVELGPVQKFSSELDYEVAALAEPLGCCLNGFERVLNMGPVGRTVVVFGAGPIGIMLVMLAPLNDADRVIVIEPNPKRRRCALDLGAEIAIDPNQSDPVAEVMNLTRGIGADMIFTACSDLIAHKQAISIVAVRGVINLFGGLPKNASHLDILSNDIHYKEACLTGSHGSTPAHHKEAITLIEKRAVKMDRLVSRRLPLPDLPSFFTSPPTGDIGLKTIVIPND